MAPKVLRKLNIHPIQWANYFLQPMLGDMGIDLGGFAGSMA
jgi:hypothetical protein